MPAPLTLAARIHAAGITNPAEAYEAADALSRRNWRGMDDATLRQAVRDAVADASHAEPRRFARPCRAPQPHEHALNAQTQGVGAYGDFR